MPVPVALRLWEFRSSTSSASAAGAMPAYPNTYGISSRLKPTSPNVTSPSFLNFYLNAVPGHEPHEVGTALATAMFHWTLHPWAVYSIVGLAIGYSTFRLGRKQLISSTFVPLVG